MKLLLLLALALVATANIAEFREWMFANSKSYSSAAETARRYQIWLANKKFIESHDADATGFTLGMNEFGDLTNDEFKTYYLGSRLTVGSAAWKSSPWPQGTIVFPAVDAYPTSVDWRTKNAVTGIKNQGQCGSCWSFSTTGSLEGANVLQGGKTLVGLSEKNLMDCSDKYGNQGCNGGLMTDAFKYIIANNGIDSEASYPYVPEDGPCKFNAANVAATMKGYHALPSGNETALQGASATIGPVSVGIDASHNSFQFYSGGVYYEPACSTTQLDHGVLVAGYGVSGSSDYWLVKNSWGTSWGLQGYIWMSRNRNNNCGIATAASYPLVNQATDTSSGSGSSGSSSSSSQTSSSSGSSSQTSSSSGSSSQTSSSSGSSSQTSSSSGSSSQTSSSSGSQTSSSSSSSSGSSASSQTSSSSSSGSSASSQTSSSSSSGSSASSQTSSSSGTSASSQTSSSSGSSASQTSSTSGTSASSQTSASSSQTSASSSSTSATSQTSSSGSGGSSGSVITIQ